MRTPEQSTQEERCYADQRLDEHGSHHDGQNPVRAKLAETPDKYDWSSYNFYIGVERAPNWLHRDLILGYFGDKVSVAQLGYKEFVSLRVGQKYDSPLKEVSASVLLGSQDFIEFIKGNYLSDFLSFFKGTNLWNQN